TDSAAVADLETEITRGKQSSRQADDINHDAVDATVVAAVIRECRSSARQQRSFVGRNRGVVSGVGRGIVAIESRLVVKQPSADDAPGNDEGNACSSSKRI